MSRDLLRSFADATEPDPGLLSRVEGRIARAPRRGPARAVALGLAIAAAAAVAVLSPPPAERVDRPLADAGTADLGDAVHARWSGAGRVEGDARALDIAWEQGEISVDVAPGRGVRLRLLTGEGVVSVVGTGFDVRRDALGTRVDVRHGSVEVRCGAEPARVLAVGASADCLPVTPAAWLGRARALHRADAGTDAVLDAVARGEVGADPAVAAELGLLKAVELSRLERLPEALAAAETALSLGTAARRPELLRLATTLSVRLGGCDRAAPHAAALAALGEPTPCPSTPESP